MIKEIRNKRYVIFGRKTRANEEKIKDGKKVENGSETRGEEESRCEQSGRITLGKEPPSFSPSRTMRSRHMQTYSEVRYRRLKQGRNCWLNNAKLNQKRCGAQRKGQRVEKGAWMWALASPGSKPQLSNSLSLRCRTSAFLAWSLSSVPYRNGK